MLCALKCDLREEAEKDDEEPVQQLGPSMIQYNEGLEVARRIGALRYLGMLSCPLESKQGIHVEQNALQCAIEV